MENQEERLVANRICEDYVESKQTKLQELKQLDKKVKRPAKIFSYIFGVLGALTFGAGLSLAMGAIGSSMPLGIIIGVGGIAMACVNYFIFKAINSYRKNKFSAQMLAIADELLNKQIDKNI